MCCIYSSARRHPVCKRTPLQTVVWQKLLVDQHQGLEEEVEVEQMTTYKLDWTAYGDSSRFLLMRNECMNFHFSSGNLRRGPGVLAERSLLRCIQLGLAGAAWRETSEVTPEASLHWIDRPG